MEYLTKQFTEPQNDMEGLKSFRTPLGLAVTADTSAMGEAEYSIAYKNVVTVLYASLKNQESWGWGYVGYAYHSCCVY